MRNLFILLSLVIIGVVFSCKQVDKEQKQLSSKSKSYQKELHSFVNHDEGLHFVKLDTTSFSLLLKFDFEEKDRALEKVYQFIEDKGIDSVPMELIIDNDTLIQNEDNVDTISITIE